MITVVYNVLQCVNKANQIKHNVQNITYFNYNRSSHKRCPLTETSTGINMDMGAEKVSATGAVRLRECVKTVEAPVSRHPREAEKVSATGAVRLRECVNTEFV